MIEQELKVYCCEHCNFVSKFAAATIRHEKFCKKNRNTKPLCYNCKHLAEINRDSIYSEELRQARLDGKRVNFQTLYCDVRKALMFNAFKRSKREMDILKNDKVEVFKYEESIDPDGGIVLRHIPKGKEIYIPMPSEVEGCSSFSLEC